MISSFAVAAGVATLFLAHALFRRITRPSLSMIRGPPSPSFLVGNLLELFQRPVGEADVAWQSQYGNIVRFKSVFGEDRLLVTDPKALQKILSTYNYQKLPNFRVVPRMLDGKNILWADGEDHRRHKSILLPGFGPNECNAFFPIFKDCAEALCMKWSETIAGHSGQRVVSDVPHWLSRGTLDALGSAIFDIQFGIIDDHLHPLAQKYHNYFKDVFGLPSATQIFVQTAAKYIPSWLLQWLVDNGPGPRLSRARDTRVTTTRIVQELVQEKAEALLQQKGNRDILTLLIKANRNATAKKKLSEEELYAQMRTLLFAGHETTANTLAWIILELARNPSVQSKLRDEIWRTDAAISARGDSQLTVKDLEGAMPYLNAVLKEGLRLYPTEPHTLRMAGHDDTLPLSKPIQTKSGSMINEILVPKGTEIVISMVAYNRNKDIWGDDAHEFKPDRWLDGAMDDRQLPSIGVYSNLLSFLSGLHACVGWRFALLEMQVFLSTVVGKFEFAMTEKAERVIPHSVLVTVPMVEGEFERGVQLPLVVSLASQEGEVY